MNGTVTLILRLLIVTCCIGAAALMAYLNRPGRMPLSFGHFMVRAGVLVVLLAVAYATFESGLRGIPGAPRLWPLASGLVWLVVGLIATVREQRTR